MKTKEKIRVKITKDDNKLVWYKKGQIYEVFNYITYDFPDRSPCFEVQSGRCGIRCEDCVVLPEQIKLLSCPFCGSEVKFSHPCSTIICPTDKCYLNNIYRTEEETIRAWNNRKAKK